MCVFVFVCGGNYLGIEEMIRRMIRLERWASTCDDGFFNLHSSSIPEYDEKQWNVSKGFK
jgi:hypothetical protein